MTEDINDTGIIITILERFEKQRLPRITEIKKRLDDGERLNEYEMEFISEALHDAKNLMPFLENKPEYQELFAQVVHFYKLVTDEALNLQK